MRLTALQRNWGALLTALLFALAGYSGAEEETPAWRRYLSPAEQAALAAIATGYDASLDQRMDAPLPTNVSELVQAWRGEMEEFAAAIAPPLESVTREPYEANGMKGIWFKPENAASDRVLLYLHGGGYVVGSPMTAAAVAGFLAREAGMYCFSLDYPLAPEHPYPAAIRGALAAYAMLLEEGYAPENIVLAGDSAGGGLTLSTLLTIQDESLPMPAGAYLLSPWTDLTQSFASHKDKSDVDMMVTVDFLDMLAIMYSGDEDRREPLVSPAFADLEGLPPLLIHVGSHESLLDDALAIAKNAADADVPVTLKVWPGYFHVFQMSHTTLEGARKALREGAAFLRAAMDGTVLADG